MRPGQRPQRRRLDQHDRLHDGDDPKLGHRSATAPAGSESSSTGSDPIDVTSPTRNALFVSSSASHPCAIDCIHVPMSDSVWPVQNRRKFRCVTSVRNGLIERWLAAVRPIR